MNARTEHAALAQPVAAPAATTALLAELRKADRIINVMLNAMTLEQKLACARQLEDEGVSPDGMARAHERAAVIAAATAAPYSASSTSSTTQQLLDIEAHAVDVQTEADRADILLRELFAKLDQAGNTVPLAATIDCFATCTARAVALMREAADHIVALVAEGGTA